MSVFVAVTIAALIVIAGLVVDGGAKASASRQAETVAAAAARAGADSGTAARLVGHKSTDDIVRAAERTLQEASVPGTVSLQGNNVVVDTTLTIQTTFLSLIGMPTLTVHGHAVAQAGRR